MEYSGINLRGQKVVGGGDGVDVARQMQVELVHWNDLRVSSAGGPALDPESGALRGLPHARKHVLLGLGAQSLRETDSGGTLPLAQRGRSDA